MKAHVWAYIRMYYIMIISVTLFAVHVRADTYYVSSTGNDSNEGSISAPWRTITHAVRNTSPGDTVMLRAGTYSPPSSIRADRGEGGSAEGRWTLTAYPGEEAIIEGDQMRLRAPYLTISGLHFRDTRLSYGDAYIEILNNRFTGGNQHYGVIEFGGSNSLIEGNIIEVEEQGLTTDHGIYLHHGSHNVIRNNYISGSRGYGIHIYDERKSGDPVDFVKLISDVIVENNFITSSKERSGITMGLADDGRLERVVIRKNLIHANAQNGIQVSGSSGHVNDIEIYNNTIVGNGIDGIFFKYSSIRNVIIKNNIVSNNGGDHIDNGVGAQGVIVDNNLYWPSPVSLKGVVDANSIVADPLFVNPAANDFHLQPNSPAIDRGVDVGLPFIGAAPDLGAFEFGDDIPVPLELVSFQAAVRGNAVELTWKTASETNIFGFEVERSSDDLRFKKIGYVDGHGTTTKPQSYQFLDEGLEGGRYYYRLKQIDADGSFEYSSSIEAVVGVPQKFNLRQNYPNPFNPETKIVYEIPTQSYVRIKVFDILGREVITLVNENKPPGYYETRWDGRNSKGEEVGNGIYLYSLEVSDSANSRSLSATKKMILVH